MLVLYLVLTLIISTFNAWSCGKGWIDAKLIGGMARLMEWCGAIMSAIGFTLVYLIVVAYAAGPDGANWLSPQRVNQMLSLGYLAILPPLLGTGLAITVQSWAHFWRRRTFGSGAIAAYNTYAQLSNMYNAYMEAPNAWKEVKNFFSDDDDPADAGSLIAFLCFVIAVAGGIVTTAIIIHIVSANVAREVRDRAAFARQGW